MVNTVILYYYMYYNKSELMVNTVIFGRNDNQETCIAVFCSAKPNVSIWLLYS